jgi:hypothetical protein
MYSRSFKAVHHFADIGSWEYVELMQPYSKTNSDNPDITPFLV